MFRRVKKMLAVADDRHVVIVIFFLFVFFFAVWVVYCLWLYVVEEPRPYAVNFFPFLLTALFVFVLKLRGRWRIYDFWEEVMDISSKRCSYLDASLFEDAKRLSVKNKKRFEFLSILADVDCYHISRASCDREDVSRFDEETEGLIARLREITQSPT